MLALGLALGLLALLPAGDARAQLRSHDLQFRPPADARVIGFHVYVSGNSMTYADYRDDINFIPPVTSGVATYRLTDLEQYDDVYIAVKSYDAMGGESRFSNEIILAAQQPQCVTTGCNDSNSCTVDTCGSTGCVFDPAPRRGTTCNDGNADTLNDVCQANGTCAGTVPQCMATGCNDNNSCTVDTCSASGCVFDPAPRRGTTCNDGNAGTINDVCQTNGSCAGTVPQCIADADCPAPADMCAGPQVCVANRCQAGTSPRPDETTCNDGSSSTRYDVCRSGVCRGFACGSDAQCSDGEACNGAERCVSNSCSTGTPMVCSDGNVCNGAETCRASTCMSGTALTCPTEDGPCFDAFCDPVMGCRVQNHPNGSVCTTSMSGSAGTCSAGVCVANPPPPPDPNSPDPNSPDPNSPPPPMDPGDGRDPRPSRNPNTTCNTVYAAATDVHQELSADSETERTIVWNAPAHPMGAMLQYGSLATGWKGLRAVPKGRNGCDAVYAVTLSNLKPGTAYSYRVSGSSPQGRVWSDVYSLTAGPVSERGRFKFAFFGGNGVQGTAQSTQAERVMGQLKRGQYPLVLGGGGYALSNEAIAAGAASNAAQAVDLWKAQASAVTGNSIFAPVLGDTEVESSTHGERAADYAEYMAMAGTAQTPHGSYSYDFGGAHFLAVNAPTLGTIHPSTAAGTAHLAWIDADLAAAKSRGARWLVVYMHADLFSSEKSEASVASVRTALGNILVRNGVNAVLSSEGNSYERSRAVRGNLAMPTLGPLADEDVTSATDGVVFVRAGAGGRTVFGNWVSAAKPAWSALRDNTQAVYLRVAVSDAKLIVTAYGIDATGKQRTLDQVTMR